MYSYSSFGYSPDNCYNYTLTISIKNDHSKAHVYLLFEAKPLPNHFILPIQAIWHYLNIQLKSNMPTNTLLKSSLILSDSYDLSTCYNKFLLHYNLPLFNKFQTIKSFFQHLQQFNTTDLLKSSFFSCNKEKSEAHIYLPDETKLLPNHIPLIPYTN